MADQSPTVKPLAPYISSSPYNTPEHEIETIFDKETNRLRRFTLCCGCITALLLICVVIVIVLAFTVYNANDPEIKLNRMTLLNGSFTKDSPYDITLVADISMKNTNYFTFKSRESTTTIYYDGIDIGEGITPPGKAKARRTVRFNVTLKILGNKLMNIPTIYSDIRDQVLNFSSYTRIDGNVKILNMVKKRIVVELNCTTEYNITAGITSDNNCFTNVDT
ncbi:hypothetical protein TanjilG_14301 [Lupinus angustifolius]|uniref:Late embryogenesis abundant protein LEA-2 subgroup domain-containing protein n=2 Tax=Lupinus angustifolius TaxID=3871 RepID=A0A1J7G177_LUPAN|nr:hypothetical protein TanjilG_14301 [Lupinus angustifolius]